MAKTTVGGFVSCLELHHLPTDLGPAIPFSAFEPPFTDAALKYLEGTGIVVVNWPQATFQVTSKGRAAWQVHQAKLKAW